MLGIRPELDLGGSVSASIKTVVKKGRGFIIKMEIFLSTNSPQFKYWRCAFFNLSAPEVITRLHPALDLILRSYFFLYTFLSPDYFNSNRVILVSYFILHIVFVGEAQAENLKTSGYFKVFNMSQQKNLN